MLMGCQQKGSHTPTQKERSHCLNAFHDSALINFTLYLYAEPVVAIVIKHLVLFIRVITFSISIMQTPMNEIQKF